VIRFNDITKIYETRGAGIKRIVALESISFAVEPGEFVSVVGRSGAGKTTLFRLALAEEKPTRGSILFNDQNIYRLGQGNLNRLRRNIGAVFQDYKLLSNATVYENIAYVMKVIGASDAEIKCNVPRILEIVELEDRQKNYPAELSGGERQRVAIARALAVKPLLLLADEPTGNLDVATGREIADLLFHLAEQEQMTMLVVTHNRELAERCSRQMQLAQGLLQ